MVKGCQKKIIIVNQTGSKYFDSAYFILKGELPRGSSEHDMMREAQNIVNGCSAEQLVAASLAGTGGLVDREQKIRPKKRLDSVIAFFSGAATVGAVVGAVSLIANLLY